MTSNVHPLLTPLTVNRSMIQDFLDAPDPCFAMGLVEERKRQCGFLALRPGVQIPPQITQGGFSFGHALLGTSKFDVLHFCFHFYGFGTYNVLVNPNNDIVRRVLDTMIESGDYHFFCISPDKRATAFRTDIGTGEMLSFSDHLVRIRKSRTNERQYWEAVRQFEQRPEPPGMLLQWVCNDNPNYLDLVSDRLEMSPS